MTAPQLAGELGETGGHLELSTVTVIMSATA